MREVFADTAYWIGLINPQDDLHRLAKEISAQLGSFRIVTSEMVLAEVLNALADYGPHIRAFGTKTVRSIVESASIDVEPQTRVLFREALKLYGERPDKDWSLTDCASFVIMARRGINEALTSDAHYRMVTRHCCVPSQHRFTSALPSS
jgi:predicted nucleic acid-binding protein